MDLSETNEPFLLHESSRAFLDGDPTGIQQRFRFRRDVLDYLAAAFVAAGGLLLTVNFMQLTQVVGQGADPDTTVAAVGLAAFFIVGGAYYLTSRHGAAAARARLIREGQVLPGTIVACSARHETSAEAALGEVTRTFVVTVDYHFTAPSGRELADRDEHDRRDLRRVGLPPDGAGVRVLYLNDQTYALM